MKKLFLSLSLAILGSHAIAGVTYTYEKNNGTVILTNKKTKDPSMKLTDARLSSTAAVGSVGQSEYEAAYKNWVKQGKSTPPLLTPRKISREVGFTGYILFSLYSGKGLISSTPYNTDYTYDTYEDCMDTRENLIYDFKKSGQDRLNPNIVYPRNVRKTYEYYCIAEVSNIERAEYSQSTLKKWEKEALAENQQQELRNKKDKQDYDQAMREIGLNPNRTQLLKVNTELSTQQVKDELATPQPVTTQPHKVRAPQTVIVSD